MLVVLMLTSEVAGGGGDGLWEWETAKDSLTHERKNQSWVQATLSFWYHCHEDGTYRLTFFHSWLVSQEPGLHH